MVSLYLYSVCTFMFIFVCSFGRSRQEIIVSSFNYTDLKYIQAVQLKFCGTKTQCDKHVSFENPDLARVWGSYKAMIPIDEPITVDGYCCSACSCDLSTCQERGTCCADILEPEIIESDIYSRYTCEFAQLRQRRDELQNGKAVWMVRSCSKGFQVDTTDKAVVKSKCENWSYYSGLDTAVPVTDKTTNITYHNRYCLECNNGHIGNAITWAANLVCTTEEEGIFLQNVLYEELLDKIKTTETCNIVYDIPKKGPAVPENFCTEPKFKECNQTGSWEVYDPFIEAACQMFTSPYSYRYKNIFCYMCNEAVTPEKCLDEGVSGFFPSFSSLLKFDAGDADVAPDEIVTKSCTGSQIYDKIKNTCRNLTCRFPRSLKEGLCVNVVETLAGVTFMMYLRLTPLDTSRGQDLFHLINALVLHVDKELNQLEIADFIYNYTVLYKFNNTEKNVNDSNTEDVITEAIQHQPESTSGASTTGPSDQTVQVISEWVVNSEFGNESADLVPATHSSFTATLPVIPTTSQGGRIAYLLFRIGIHVDSRSSGVDASVIDGIINMDGGNITVNGNTDWAFNVSLDDFSITDKTVGNNVSVVDTSDNTTLEVFPMSLTSLSIIKLDEERQPIILARKLTCPLVQVSAVEDPKINGTGFTINVYGEKIETKDFYELPSRKILICADTFLHALNNTDESGVLTTPSSEPTAKEILSLILMILSVLCSIFTFVTYCIFKALRTQPGVNNMCLVLNLIIAQLLFQFSVGQANQLAEWACVTTGLLVHFFWLMVVFWMNVCSFHMFRVFAKVNKLQHSPKTTLFKTTFLYNMYCVLSSAIFVVINITVGKLSPQEESIGYGVEVCYISSREMYIYMIVLPIYATVIVNIILFVIVVIKISRMSTIESTVNSNRNYFSIYAKLASITGVTWIAGVVFFYTDIEFFEYLFIIFNAGQGVYIFLSFICNKRVFLMYKTLLTKKKSVKKGRSTTKENTIRTCNTSV